jgi:hypothetical protein
MKTLTLAIMLASGIQATEPEHDPGDCIRALSQAALAITNGHEVRYTFGEVDDAVQSMACLSDGVVVLDLTDLIPPASLNICDIEEMS